MVEKLVLPRSYEKSYESLRTFMQKYPTSPSGALTPTRMCSGFLSHDIQVAISALYPITALRCVLVSERNYKT